MFYLGHILVVLCCMSNFHLSHKCCSEGDSGSPIMRKMKGVYYLMGIVSWGPEDCGNSIQAAVNTDVLTFKDWILKKIEQAGYDRAKRC